jgi:plasmid maintenance system antidote protein VapI
MKWFRKRRGISADTAMRLARYFGGDARSWLNLQSAYDLRVAEISNAKRIVREVSPAAAKAVRLIRKDRSQKQIPAKSDLCWKHVLDLIQYDD